MLQGWVVKAQLPICALTMMQLQIECNPIPQRHTIEDAKIQVACCQAGLISKDSRPMPYRISFIELYTTFTKMSTVYTVSCINLIEDTSFQWQVTLILSACSMHFALARCTLRLFDVLNNCKTLDIFYHRYFLECRQNTGMNEHRPWTEAKILACNVKGNLVRNSHAGPNKEMTNQNETLTRGERKIDVLQNSRALVSKFQSQTFISAST